jgi:NAD(P)-dependent dehydrogenase (short-subunit alcohol dehydrogenase family)
MSATSSTSHARDESDLRGKVAVVTGAASGIGLAVARRAAALGMSVVMADIDPAALRSARLLLSDGGAEALDVATDVSLVESVQELANTAERRFGSPWLVVNNAGVTTWKRTWDLAHEDWSWVMGVNLFGVVHGIESFLPGMLDRDEGHIVNTASMSGLVVSANTSAPYAASKHAVVGLSESLFRELHALGSRVGVSVLCPGPVTTNIARAGRNRPERYGGAVGASTVPASRYGADSEEAGDVAEQVLGAVVDRRFWILTHVDAFGPPVIERMRGAVHGTNPGTSSEDPFHRLQPWSSGTRGIVSNPDTRSVH